LRLATDVCFAMSLMGTDVLLHHLSDTLATPSVEPGTGVFIVFAGFGFICDENPNR